MTADNRPVATDALATLGTIIDKTAARDAIHLAVEPVVAAHTLRPRRCGTEMRDTEMRDRRNNSFVFTRAHWG
jgi:hypothetical protein